MVYQYLCRIIQYSLAACIKAKPFWKVAHVFFTLSVIVGPATFTAGSSRLAGRWDTLLLRIDRLLWSHINFFSVGFGEILTASLLGRVGGIVLASVSVEVGDILPSSFLVGVGRIVLASF